ARVACHLSAPRALRRGAPAFLAPHAPPRPLPNPSPPPPPPRPAPPLEEGPSAPPRRKLPLPREIDEPPRHLARRRSILLKIRERARPGECQGERRRMRELLREGYCRLPFRRRLGRSAQHPLRPD